MLFRSVSLDFFDWLFAFVVAGAILFLIPFAVYSTSFASTVMFSSTQRGQRTFSSMPGVLSAFWDKHRSHISTGTPQVRHFFFPTYRSQGSPQTQHLAKGAALSFSVCRCCLFRFCFFLSCFEITPPSPCGLSTLTASRLSKTKFFPRQNPPS